MRTIAQEALHHEILPVKSSPAQTAWERQAVADWLSDPSNLARMQEDKRLRQARVHVAPENPLVASLTPKLGLAVVKAWLRPLHVSVSHGRALIRCPTKGHRAWVQRHYAAEIAVALRVSRVRFLLMDDPGPSREICR